MRREQLDAILACDYAMVGIAVHNAKEIGVRLAEMHQMIPSGIHIDDMDPDKMTGRQVRSLLIGLRPLLMLLQTEAEKFDDKQRREKEDKNAHFVKSGFYRSESDETSEQAKPLTIDAEA